MRRAGKSIEIKTVEEIYRYVWLTIQDLYEDGNINNFLDTMANILESQLTKAFAAAINDSDLDAGEIDNEPFAGKLEDEILAQYDFVDKLAKDIVEARNAETGVDAFEPRANLWASQYDNAYNAAILLAATINGENLKWEIGETEAHCNSCASLDGVVAPATLWEELGVHPKDGPNDKLDCGGWRCDCKCDPTDEKATPGAREIIMIAMAQG